MGRRRGTNRVARRNRGRGSSSSTNSNHIGGVSSNSTAAIQRPRCTRSQTRQIRSLLNPGSNNATNDDQNPTQASEEPVLEVHADQEFEDGSTEQNEYRTLRPLSISPTIPVASFPRRLYTHSPIHNFVSVPSRPLFKTTVCYSDTWVGSDEWKLASYSIDL